MKLFVDDMRICPAGWELARTNTEAIRILATGMVDEISLDHDIEFDYPAQGAPYRCIVAETFSPIAYYIALMNNKPKVIFHTGNIEAGQRMAEIIGCPFDHTMYHEEVL